MYFKAVYMVFMASLGLEYLVSKMSEKNWAKMATKAIATNPI